MKQFAIPRLMLSELLNQSFLPFILRSCTRLFAYYMAVSASSVMANPQNSASQPQPLMSTDVEQVPGTIVLDKFEVIGNRVLPESEIDKLLEPYLMRPISFIELMEVQQRITKLYVERGYFTSGAYIPPQTVKNRTVKIEIIEGSIEEIKIYGLQDLHPGYIQRRIESATQPPVNQEQLLKALQLLQLDPLIKNITAELSQGVNPGQSYLEVEVEEADSFFTELTLDNYRTSSVGSFSRQLAISDQNLLGFGDRFDVSYINTDGSNSLENLSYTIPLGTINNKLRLGYSISSSDIITEPFQDLDLSSKNRYLELSYRHPLWETPTQVVALGLILSHQDTQLSLMDIGFPTLARGSDLEGTTKVSALRLIQEYSDRGSSHVFAIRSQFNIGLNAFDATSNPDGIPDSSFLVWRGQLQYLRMLSPRTNILLRSELQLADRGLVSQEQFSAGGALSARGYAQDLALGDNGFFASAELVNLLWQTSAENLTLELNPFFDFARVWNSDKLPLDTSTLVSLGLGLQFSIKDSLIARLDWGLPLIEAQDLPGDSLQENGFYFSVKFKPF
ncbi:MAG: ShlB/FhaC/HecB family hemolysin secretion/activation protein [Cyanobacteria bacterium P01_G01_bin.67]